MSPAERRAGGRLEAATARMLDAADREAADTAEVLATIRRIEDREVTSWVSAWADVAAMAETAAATDAARGRVASALTHYRHAATYYGAAFETFAHSQWSDRRLQLWRRQRFCWERTVDLSPVAGERLPIPYGRTTLPGYFFRAPDAAPAARRPVVVINHDLDTPTSHAWVGGGACAGERGYHWMTFDGPGQQATLLERGMPARPDWEAVLTPVLDTLTTRADVDPLRIAVIGIGHAGYLVPRALTSEHRFAAAVANPGVVDISTAWTDQLSDLLRAQLAGGDRAAFDREIALAELFWPEIRSLRLDGAPFGPGADSVFALYETIARYRLGDEVALITTPLLVTDADPRRLWPGQGRMLHDRLTGPKEFLGTTPRTSQPQSGVPRCDRLCETRIFDWLDRQMAGGG